MVECDEQALQDVRLFLSLFEFVARTTDDDFKPVVHETYYQLFEVQQFRTAFHEGDVVDVEGGLELCQLKQLIDYHVGNRALSKRYNNAKALAVGFVVGVNDVFDFFVVDKFGDFADLFRLVDHVRDFVENNLRFAAVSGFDVVFRADNKSAASRQISVFNSLITIDYAARRKIGSLDNRD